MRPSDKYKPGQLIDIDLSEDCERVIEGALVKQTTRIFLLLLFKRPRFDGFIAFRDKDVKRWRTWSRKEVKRLTRDNRAKWLSEYPFDMVGSFQTFFQMMREEPLGVSLYGEEGFYVGMVRRIDRRSVRMFLVNEDADRTWLRTFPLKRIESIEFTPYTKKFKSLLTSNEN